MKVLALLYVLIVTITLSSQDIAYVKPNASSAICPSSPCLTLDQYLQESDSYFTTGSSFIFLAGNHTIRGGTLNLISLSNVTLRGEDTDLVTSILCADGVAIHCSEVSDLTIEGVTFVLPGNQGNDTPALNIVDSRVSITNTRFLGIQKGSPASLLAVRSTRSSVSFVNCAFEDMTGYAVGAIHDKGGGDLTFLGSNFTGNKAKFGNGGAINVVSRTRLHLEGTLFHNNFGQKGGAIFCVNCLTLTMTGNNIFDDNHSMWGGAIHLSVTDPLNISGAVQFIENTATRSGGAIYTWLSLVEFHGSSIIFDRNSAMDKGGALYMEASSIVTSTDNVTFSNNRAKTGGALFMSEVPYRESSGSGMLSGNFINNTANDGYGGALYITKFSNITFRETTFLRNTGKFVGGIFSKDSTLSFRGNTWFGYNTGLTGGAMKCQYGVVSLSGIATFAHNTAHDGGALYSIGTKLAIRTQGRVNFTLNTAAHNGGAMYFKTRTTLGLEAETDLTLWRNHASEYGGGIYHEDSPTTAQCHYPGSEFSELPYCFLQLEQRHKDDIFPVSFSSYDSTAGVDGAFLYGGLLDKCRMTVEHFDFTSYVYFLTGPDMVRIDTSTATNKTKDITSDVYELCVCHSNNTDCNTKSRNLEVFRGQTFTIPLLALAQGTSTTGTNVIAVTSQAKLEIHQTTQILPDFCHGLSYTLYSTGNHEELILYPDGPCRDIGLARVTVKVSFLACPDAFSLSGERCVCEERLQAHDVNCTIGAEENYLAKNAGSMLWIGALYSNDSYQGLILDRSCPADYCETETVQLTLADLDRQCKHNRSGKLCGECAGNLSLLLGTSRCALCHNTHLSLLLPMAAAGIALVVFLSVFRLTIVIGALNSLILYANIVHVNRRLFFPSDRVNVLTVFLAWMNLDFGFETCFYSGMDEYAQTWLQFAFPVYVWILIGLIIISSRYSITVSKLIGHNPIAVLATLLLMSYTKMLKIIIEVYSYAELEYPDRKTTTVWLKDANIPYLRSKHLILAAVTSLVLVFLFLPYTLLLLLGSKLHHITGRKYLRWLNRLNPLLDSYYAPYQTHTRYWTGFLLLVRCALYIVFSLSPLDRANTSLLAITITFTTIGFASGYIHSGRIYKNRLDNIVEALLFLNLIVLSTTTLTGLNPRALRYVLVGTVLVLTLTIIVYQIYLLCIAKRALWTRLRTTVVQAVKSPTAQSEQASRAATTYNPYKNATKSVVALRESLLESNQSSV